jgi:hypothetical protein
MSLFFTTSNLQDAGEWLSLLAFLAAAVLPFFLVLRWEGIGLWIAVVGVYAILLAAAFIIPDDTLEGAAFQGVWLILGLPFMFVWCAAVGIVELCGWGLWRFGKMVFGLHQPQSDLTMTEIP